MFKRVALFLATNLAVMVLLGIVLSVLQGVFGVSLGNNGALIVMAALFGFGGSMISLMLSKWMAKRSTGAHVIEQPRNEAEQWLVDTVRRQAENSGIRMPEVAIYDAPEINAFATGPSRNNSLVAVSTGLLRAMDRDEAEAVVKFFEDQGVPMDVVFYTNYELQVDALASGELAPAVLEGDRLRPAHPPGQLERLDPGLGRGSEQPVPQPRIEAIAQGQQGQQRAGIDLPCAQGEAPAATGRGQAIEHLRRIRLAQAQQRRVQPPALRGLAPARARLHALERAARRLARSGKRRTA